VGFIEDIQLKFLENDHMKKIIIKLLMLSLSVVFIGVSCSKQNSKAKQGKDDTHGLNLADMDTTVSPGMNFYQYADGGWLKSHPVPADRSSYSSLYQLVENNNRILKSILENASQSHAPEGSVQQKVGDFFASGMDTVSIQKVGLSPIEPLLKRLNTINNRSDLLRMAARLRTEGFGSMYGFYVNQDDKNATKMAAYIAQGGLSLPNKGYYLKNDKRSKKIRHEFIKHVTKMFELMGETAKQAKQKSQIVMNIETRLARHSKTPVQLRDPESNYHKMSLGNLYKLAPNINWKQHLNEMHINHIQSVIVGQPAFMSNLNNMLQHVSIEQWKVYLAWHIIDSAAPYLSSQYEEENFKFYGKELNGQQKMRPRWKRVLSAVNRGVGFDLGKLYVKRAFPPEAKAKALEMVNDIRDAFKERIQNLDWMSPETKKLAVHKLEAIVTKIGYPDKWRDYSELKITRDSYIGNVMRSNVFAYNRMINKLGKPVDRTEWQMTPQTVNAYYNPNMNEIVFPAGFLQPPFFDPKADAALNYGEMGVVMGHEMTHGFDDQGSQYDAKGNLHNWWTKEDRKRFNKRAQALVHEYDQFVVLDSLHLNGKLTVGENIADNGGLSLAFAALQKYYQKHGKPGKIQGFSPNQRFFLAYARIQKANYRPELLENLIRTNPHSPAKYRLIGAIENMSQFYTAFNIKKEDSLYVAPDNRANVWAAQ